MVLAGGLGASTARAQDGPTDAERELAERYVPILMLKEQDGPCDAEGEPFEPTDVDIVLDNDDILLREVSRGDPVRGDAPGAADLFDRGEGFYLDFPGSSLSPGCIYEQDFRRYSVGTPPTVYAHVVQQADEPDRMFVQYWFYWYYNDWNNKHESDWEGITLEFEASSVEEALASTPTAVGYSQHEGGERAGWDDDKLRREGDRPIVYPSAGSHASYFGSSLYLGRSASEGFGCDDTTGPSRRIDPTVVVLPDAPDGPDDPFAWLGFEGRWGERQSGSFNGPTGPALKDRWLYPASSFDELRSSSVAIPAGDAGPDPVVGAFCGIVEFGSGTMIALAVSPTRVAVAIAVVLLIAIFLVKRTDWALVEARPLDRRRRAGQIFRGTNRTYWTAPLAFALIGSAYVIVAFLTALVVVVVRAVPLVGGVIVRDDQPGGIGFEVIGFAGGLAGATAFFVVNAAVADYLDRGRSGVAGAIESLRAVGRRWRGLAQAIVLALAIVFALAFTIIGLPWAIRQAVRYQFLGQAVMIDERSGRAALDRSSEQVRGRWFHTAAVLAILQGGIGLIALVAVLIVLVVVTSLPLWVISLLFGVVHLALMPAAAIAVCLLYGDATAERNHAPRADPVPVR